MANCPNCGSSHIHLTKETNVSWGRAVAGWALFGVVGGVVGAVTGEDRNVNACLNCGTSWKAADLYATLQTIEKLTGVTLDLAEEQDRLYLNGFMAEVGPDLEYLPTVEKKALKLVEDAKKKSGDKAALGCTYGLFASFMGCSAIASAFSGSGAFFVFLIPPLIGLGIGMLIDAAKKNTVDQQIKKAKREAITMRLEAEENLKAKAAEFARNNL